MDNTKRKAGQRFQEDDSPAAQEAAYSVGRAAEYSKGSGGASANPDNYKPGGKYNSGRRIGYDDYQSAPASTPTSTPENPSTDSAPSQPSTPSQTKGVSTPMMDRILGGYYEIDDSTDRNNARVNSQIDNFRTRAERYDADDVVQTAIDNGKRNSFINIEELDNRVQSREMYNNAKADVSRSEIFGDVWKNQYTDNASSRQPWQTATPGKDIETPDFEDMFERYTNFKK